MSKRFQFVWWGWRVWRGIGRECWDADSGIRKIYRWSFSIGPLEIRRWETRRLSDTGAHP